MENRERGGANLSLDNGEYRGAGGKLKKPKRPPATPYARPQQPWLAKLVAPTRHLITRIPSFFSKARPEATVYSEEMDIYDDLKTDETALRSDMNVNSTVNEVIGAKVTGDKKENKDVHSITDQNEQERKDVDPSGLRNFDEIEKLVSSRSFSRDDVQRLIGILRSQSMSSKATIPDGRHLQEISTTDTMLLRHQSSYHGDSSPVEIAKAYMRNRIPETPSSSRHISYEGHVRPNELVLTPSPNPATRWPGAHCDLASQSERRRFGLSYSQRTPYSKSLYSKSKSKLQGAGERRFDLTSTPDNPRSVLDHTLSSGSEFRDSGSVGPIRRIRHRNTVEAPTGFRSLRSSSFSHVQKEDSNPSFGSNSGMERDVEAMNNSSSNMSIEANQQKTHVGVPPHSSHLARRILEHLDRNPPTPKEKFAELKQATLWNRSSTDATSNHHLSGGHRDPSEKLEKVYRNKIRETSKETRVKFLDSPKHNELQDVTVGIKLHQSGQPTVSDTNAASSSNKHRATEEAAKPGYLVEPSYFPKVITSASSDDQNCMPKKPPVSGAKPVLPAISINKRTHDWALTSDNTVGFTFPVSASSGSLYELPTPSISPLLASRDSTLHDNGLSLPSYSFGMKNADSLVFTFPSLNDSLGYINPPDVSFSFGSDKRFRISFSSIGNDAVCC